MGPEWPAAVKRTVPPLKAPHGGRCAGREVDGGGGGGGREKQMSADIGVW